jgi:hypothetical protein
LATTIVKAANAREETTERDSTLDELVRVNSAFEQHDPNSVNATLKQLIANEVFFIH